MFFLLCAISEVVVLTPEQLVKQQLKAKIKEEYLAAMAHEGKFFRLRTFNECGLIFV